MDKSLILNADEIAHVSSALETFIDNDSASVAGIMFQKDIKERLVSSCLNKLSSYSPLTYFTKQEYTVMFAATLFVIQLFEKNGSEADDALFSAQNKLSMLAE